MRQVAAICGIAVATLASLLRAQVPAPSTTPPAANQPAPVAHAAPLAWRQNVFAIPFRVNAVAAANAPVEVHLHASVDQGKQWRLVERVPTSAGKFVFRAPSDGEYWFAMRTMNRNGTFDSSEPLQAGLRVLVDTTAPQLTLTGTRGSAGEVQLQWQADDRHLKADSLKLEYQTAADQPWRPLSAAPAEAARTAQSGKATWFPTDHRGQILVRAEVQDTAGNRVVSQTQIALTPDAATAAAPLGTADSSAGSSIANTVQQTVVQPTSTPSAPQGWPADRVAHQPLERQVADANASPTVAPLASPPIAPPTNTAPVLPIATNAVSQTPSPRQTTGNSAGGDLIEMTSPQTFSLPAGAKPRMVNSTLFELQYDVVSGGSAGLAKVELWGTEDGGRTWSVYQADDDLRSPVSAEVGFEGLYGFRIVVQAANGGPPKTPVAGDQPEIWIGVDQTRPSARLTGVEAKTGRAGDEIHLRWETSDKYPLAKPAVLACSAAAEGPWTTVASDLPGNGSVIWKPDRTVPDNVFVRLEVRDQAGNTTSIVSEHPVALPSRQPQGRIRDVQPLERSAYEQGFLRR